MTVKKLVGPKINLLEKSAALIGCVGDPFMDNCIKLFGLIFCRFETFCIVMFDECEAIFCGPLEWLKWS